MMVNELKDKIVQLEELLRKRKSTTSTFFYKMIGKLEDGDVSDVINSIMNSYVLTQYADFNCREENLFSQIWGIANELKAENLPDSPG